MRPLRAFLLICQGPGHWEVSTHREFESLLEAWKPFAGSATVTTVIHVGFWRPDTSAFDRLVAQFPNRVLVTASARFALPAPCVVAPRAAGVVEGVPVFAILSGWGYTTTAADLGLEDAACTSVQSGNTSASLAGDSETKVDDWVARLREDDPELMAYAITQGIVDEPSFLAAELRLPLPLRTRLSAYRFSILFGAPPSLENVLAGLRYAPAWLLELSVDALDLPMRALHVFRRYSIHCVKDLAKYDEAKLLKLANMGRGSVGEVTMRLVHAWFFGSATLAIDENSQLALLSSSYRGRGKESESASKEDPIQPIHASNFKKTIEAALDLLTESKAKIMRMRMGFSGRSMTLQEIGDIIGVSRERIRQIESKCVQKLAQLPLWRDELEARLEALLSQREEALPLVGLEILDPWFRGVEDVEDLVDYVFEHFCGKRFSLVRERGQVLVSKLSQVQWDQAVRLGRQLLEARLGSVLTEDEARSMIEALLVGAGDELRSELWTAVTRWAHFIMLENGNRSLVSLGSGAESLVEAILMDSDRPLHYTEIAERIRREYGRVTDVRRVHNAAASVGLLLGRGTYGLMKHFPLLDPEARWLVAEVEDLIESADPQKQWHCSEICTVMEERGLDFEGRLTPYVVNITLERSKCLANLRRMIWVSRSTGFRSSANRIDVHQAIVSLLQAEGRPLPVSEIRQRLARERGLNDIFQIQPEGLLLRVGAGVWGLVNRDLPFSETSATAVMEEVEQILEWRGKGLHVTEIHGALCKTADLARHANDPTLFLALAQRTDSLRIDKGQHIYLAKWEGSRRLSTREAVRRVLKAAGPLGLTLEGVAAKVEALIERPLARIQISYKLRDIGARYDEKSACWALPTEEETNNEEEFDLMIT